MLVLCDAVEERPLVEATEKPGLRGTTGSAGAAQAASEELDWGDMLEQSNQAQESVLNLFSPNELLMYIYTSSSSYV